MSIRHYLQVHERAIAGTKKGKLGYSYHI